MGKIVIFSLSFVPCFAVAAWTDLPSTNILGIRAAGNQRSFTVVTHPCTRRVADISGKKIINSLSHSATDPLYLMSAESEVEK